MATPQTPYAGAGLLGDLSPAEVLLAAGASPALVRAILAGRGIEWRPRSIVVEGARASR